VSDDEEADWGDAMRREVEPIAKAFDRFLRDARKAKTSGGPALPLVQRVALMADASLRELLSSGERPVAHQATAALAINITAEVTAYGSVTLPRLGVSGQMAKPNCRRGIDVYQLVVVVLWLLVLVGPEAIAKANLSSGATATVDDYYAVIAAIGPAITVDYYQRRRSG
jgi:hypothetical protein